MTNKLKLFFPIFFLLIALTVSSINVNANAAITYNFYNDKGQSLDNVNALAYDCLDSKCVNVKIPAFTNGDNLGNSNDNPPNTDLTITFPTRLETQYGYGLYYYKDGYLPVESFANWAGNGATTHNIYFTKKDGCSSHIENFRIINADQPNLPIQILVKAKLDATTYSAFSSNPYTPEYVPMEFKDFYSAETKIVLKILDSDGRVVFLKEETLDLFMDSSDEVMFEWVPKKSGVYRAEIKTDVTDSQCSSSIPQSVTSGFSVVRTSLDKCYTLINNLMSSVVEPYPGENVKILANKISNYRDDTGNLQALGTDVNMKVYDPSGNLMNSQEKTLPKNLDTLNPAEFSFNFVPSKNGLYTIKVHGIANDPICSGKENLDETETMNLLVKDQGVIDLNLRTIGNKQVNENSELKIAVIADYNGRRNLRFSAANLPEGASFNEATKVFTYKPSYDTVSHSLLNDVKRLIGIDLSKDFFVTFKVSDGRLSDQEIIRIKVIDVNRNPVLEQINDITVNEGSLVKISPSATDADNDDMRFSYQAPLNSNGEWRTKVGDRGLYLVKISVKDSFGAEDSQTVKITVLGEGEIPEEDKFVHKHDINTKSLFLEQEDVKAGDYLIVYTKVKNEGNRDESQVRIKITIPEIGIVEKKVINSLDKNDQRLRVFFIKIPENTIPGHYVLKSQVSNSMSQETEAIEFRVI